MEQCQHSFLAPTRLWGFILLPGTFKPLQKKMLHWQQFWRCGSCEYAALWHGCSLGSFISKTRQRRLGACKTNTILFLEKDMKPRNKPIHCCQELTWPLRLRGGCIQVGTMSILKVLVSSYACKDVREAITCRGSCSWLRPSFCIWKDVYVCLYQEKTGWKLV